MLSRTAILLLMTALVGAGCAGGPQVEKKHAAEAGPRRLPKGYDAPGAGQPQYHGTRGGGGGGGGGGVSGGGYAGAAQMPSSAKKGCVPNKPYAQLGAALHGIDVATRKCEEEQVARGE